VIVKTNWSNLSSPYLCGLLATNPSQYSATLHNAGYETLNLKFAYHSFKINDLKVAMDAMLGMGLRGYSVTIPFKEEALPYLDIINSDAAEIEAVNTIINSGNQLLGFNTDWIGIKNSFTEVRTDYSASKALILGAGGASKAAIYALKKMGVRSIAISNRTTKRAKEVASKFAVSYVEAHDLNAKLVSRYEIIINATPLIEVPFFPYQAINKDHILFEMITSDTKLTKTGENIGATVIPGIRMLLHQGLEQFRLFTEKHPPEKEMEDSLIRYYQTNKK
jgi:shikimate dehydrogenase